MTSASLTPACWGNVRVSTTVVIRPCPVAFAYQGALGQVAFGMSPAKQAGKGRASNNGRLGNGMEVRFLGRTLRQGSATNCQYQAAVKAIPTWSGHNSCDAATCGQLRQGRIRDLAEVTQWA
jgi:hypothetical protein